MTANWRSRFRAFLELFFQGVLLVVVSPTFLLLAVLHLYLHPKRSVGWIQADVGTGATSQVLAAKEVALRP